MFLQKIINKKLFVTIMFSLSGFVMQAQDGATKTVTSGNNMLAILLIITAAVLVFVIWGMGQVLIALSRQMLDKNKTSTKIISLSILSVLSFTCMNVLAQDVTTIEAVKIISNYGGLSETTFYFLLSVILTEVLTILFLFFLIRRVYAELIPAKAAAIAKESKLAALWIQLDKKLFIKAIPIEQEADFLLDHDYDGIQELDNALPPWWKYGFIITIGIAIFYFYHFEMGDGQNPAQEYQEEMVNAQISKDEYDARNKDKIDEANVPMADAAGVQTGKDFFMANCIACHGAHGEGGAGPNLTDNYWLHKGNLNDIFNTIKKGYSDKGMQSWAVKFSPKEISQIASFITTLRGSNPPNPKAPQGDIYVPVGSIDSTKKTAVAFATIK